jgi:hypothetical protein
VGYSSLINMEDAMPNLTYEQITVIRAEVGANALGLIKGLLECNVPVGCESNTARARELVAQWDATVANAEALREQARQQEAEQAELRG